MTLEITGNLQKRFVQDAVLLHKLNPVRGSPTAYGLDRHPHNTDVSREVLLKRKFLDSFALLASTHKDGDRVSAATLEVGAPEGSIVRIASNAGVCASTLVLLRDVMEDLHTVSVMGLTDERRTIVLLKIISLDSPKIRHYFAELGKHRSDILRTEQFLPQLSSTFNPSEIEKFFTWMGNLNAITTVAAEASPLELLPYILWAEKAKWEFSTYLEALFYSQGAGLPGWIYSIYKLGRYAVASRALCQLPAEYRGLFCPMRIETVEPFARLEFVMKENELPLRDTLRRFVTGLDHEFARRLATIWGVANPELCFRKACHLQLAVHAELQLIAYYDQNPELMPPFRFMGVSKKSCFLCQRFLQSHPTSFSVSSCHQKLYLAWRSPPTSNQKAYKTYKSVIKSMCISMESVARQELLSRIGSAKTFQLDSTAGVSLTGLVDYRPPSPAESLNTTDDSSPPGSSMESSPDSPEDEDGNAPAQTTPAKGEELSPKASRTERSGETTSLPSQICRGNYHNLDFVLNIRRAEDPQRRDLVASEDILDTSQKPSWQKLVEILSDTERFGVHFVEEEEFLVIDEILWVRNERQFHACLQFLRNSGCCNVGVEVRTYGSLKLKTS
ncbi:hypothetical protein BDP55DRAFT_681755 [Colletotrichum godetiae]|uniref:Uncharacterized protein n=1 Tax=Colletotrichum godetiae TaxID=1209918 RepID=A0AAJ0ERR3_9PEZI|nr:uncharacterized protein BDP55DRAFT_681755 [Colletotrichum godetiae]KAK1658789.1 hypothetical protein BDP55DRAFT_681755 [Colletotrichum godetiae]